MEKESSSEIVLVRYYNVLIYLIFRLELDEYKKTIFISRIDGGEKMMMKDIYEWCKEHRIPLEMKFIYRKDFPILANIWNWYSYRRFKLEMRKGDTIKVNTVSS